MSSPRLPRFKRAATTRSIQLGTRDHEILRVVAQHRFLTSAHIKELIGSSQQVLRRLQLLYHHGYLERPRAQLDYYHLGGSRPIVYALGNKGAAVLGLGHRHREKNCAIGRIFLEHALLVSEVMVALKVACHRVGQIRLIDPDELTVDRDSANQRTIFRWNVVGDVGQKLGVAPDRTFALEYPAPGGQRERVFFFLEADRGTMPVIRQDLNQTSIYRKLLAYAETWSQHLHQTHFGFHRFRVLLITESRERLESMISACSRLRQGRGIFLLADRSVLSNVNLLFAAVWRTGRPGGLVSLLDDHRNLPKAANFGS